MNQILESSAFLLAGFLPSLLWLRFFQKRDEHPEPLYLVSRVFLGCIILAPVAIFAQWLFIQWAQIYNPAFLAAQSPHFFLWAAFVEEVIKCIPVFVLVLRNPEFDEPVDAMVYMVASGLGFAAIENILVTMQTAPHGLAVTAQLWVLRFLGATLLHAVASGIIGYFIGISWFYHHHSKKIITAGITLATMLHFGFNMLLVVSEQMPSLVIGTSILLIIITYLVTLLFFRLQHHQKTLSGISS